MDLNRSRRIWNVGVIREALSFTTSLFESRDQHFPGPINIQSILMTFPAERADAHRTVFILTAGDISTCSLLNPCDGRKMTTSWEHCAQLTDRRIHDRIP